MLLLVVQALLQVQAHNAHRCWLERSNRAIQRCFDLRFTTTVQSCCTPGDHPHNPWLTPYVCQVLLSGGADGTVLQWDVSDGTIAESRFAGPSMQLRSPFGPGDKWAPRIRYVYTVVLFCQADSAPHMGCSLVLLGWPCSFVVGCSMLISGWGAHWQGGWLV